MTKTPTYGTTSYCCAENKDTRTVRWLEQDHYGGPDKTGWSMVYGLYGDCYINVKYCPFCGKDLEEGDLP